MSGQNLKKRRKSENDLEENLNEEADNTNGTDNGSLQLATSTSSYYTAPESIASESFTGGLDRATPGKYKLSTVEVASAENVIAKKEEEKEKEEKEKEEKEEKKEEEEEEEEKIRLKSILKDNVQDVAPQKDGILQKETSPVKFQLDESRKFTDVPRHSLRRSTPEETKTDEEKAQTEAESTLKQMKADSRKSMKTESAFYTNLGIGEAFVYMVLPPDGGYGWFIVLVSFLTQMIIDGIVFSIGITLPYIAKDLKVGESSVIFISAVQIAFYYLSGPVTSAIINRLGFRKVASIGAVGGSVCFAIASFSPNLAMMIVFYSVLGGPLLSMTWISSQLIVGYYFEKYRPIASGLSCSGSGVGIFLFVELNSHLVEKIGWRNNIRAQAGFIIITFFLSFAFIEVAPSKIGIMRDRKEDVDLLSDSSPEELEVSSFSYADPTFVKLDAHSVDYIHLESIEITKTQKFKSELPNCFKTLCMKCSCKKRKRVTVGEDDDVEDGVKRYVIKKDIIDRQDLFYTGPADYKEYSSGKREIISGKDVELIEDEKRVEAINYTFSVHGIHETTEPKPSEAYCCGCIKLSRFFPKKIKKAFLLLFNFQLFRILEFRILFFSAFCFAFGLNIPFLFSKERADLPDEEKNLIPSIIGGSNFMSRISSGFIAFTFRRYVAYVCGSAITTGGLVVLISAFYGSTYFWFQMMYAVLFGMAPGFFSSLRAIIYVKYLGIQNLTNAFGLIAMGMGTAVFLGTVLSGIFNDISGSHMISFVLSGTFITISGVLKVVLPILSRKNQKLKLQT